MAAKQMNQRSASERASVAYFDHEHRKREYIRRFAGGLLAQDLWSGPPWAVFTLKGADGETLTCGDHSEAEIGNPCSTSSINKDI